MEATEAGRVHPARLRRCRHDSFAILALSYTSLAKSGLYIPVQPYRCGHLPHNPHPCYSSSLLTPHYSHTTPSTPCAPATACMRPSSSRCRASSGEWRRCAPCSSSSCCCVALVTRAPSSYANRSRSSIWVKYLGPGWRKGDKTEKRKKVEAVVVRYVVSQPAHGAVFGCN